MDARVFRVVPVVLPALTALANIFDMLFPGFLSPAHQAAVAQRATHRAGGHPQLWLSVSPYLSSSSGSR